MFLIYRGYTHSIDDNNKFHTILNISTDSIILTWPPFTKQTAASNSITVITVLQHVSLMT